MSHENMNIEKTVVSVLIFLSTCFLLLHLTGAAAGPLRSLGSFPETCRSGHIRSFHVRSCPAERWQSTSGLRDAQIHVASCFWKAWGNACYVGVVSCLHQRHGSSSLGTPGDIYVWCVSAQNASSEVHHSLLNRQGAMGWHTQGLRSRWRPFGTFAFSFAADGALERRIFLCLCFP